MLHVLRRNVDLTILLFNNRIYGLTKGQYSPTSELGQGDQVHAAGLGRPAAQPAAPSRSAAGATFVARTVDRNIAHMEETLKRAAAHKGTAFVEILQNCNVYNDMAWNVLYDKESKVEHELRLEHGKPLLFGPPDDRKALVLDGVQAQGRRRRRTCRRARSGSTTRPTRQRALVLAELFAPDFPVPLGVLASERGADLRGHHARPGAARHLRARPGRHRQAADVGRHLDDQS